jgi:hypothetical protein
MKPLPLITIVLATGCSRNNTPAGQWSGACDVQIDVPAHDFEDEYSRDLMLDVVVEGNFATATEVAADPDDDGGWTSWSYDGTWIAPTLSTATWRTASRSAVTWPG